MGWCPGSGGTATVMLFTFEKGDIGETMVTLEHDEGGPAGTYDEVTIADPEPGWRAGRPVELDDSRPYLLRAWNRDGDRAANFPFQVDELRRPADPARPILVKTRVGDDGYESTFRSPEVFRQASGREC
jgi:hypothetical protein